MIKMSKEGMKEIRKVIEREQARNNHNQRTLRATSAKKRTKGLDITRYLISIAVVSLLIIAWGGLQFIGVVTNLLTKK